MSELSYLSEYFHGLMEQVFSLAEKETTGREKSSNKVYVYNEIPFRTYVNCYGNHITINIRVRTISF